MKILDIGSNNGDFIKTYCNTNDFIIAIEANPELKNPFNYPNIIWKNVAISEKHEETLNFYIATVNTISSLNLNWLTSGRFKNHFSNKYIKVLTTTIDKIFEEYGNFDHIKLDVEGGKLEVSFTKEGSVYNNVLLKGPATFVFQGEINL